MPSGNTFEKAEKTLWDELVESSVKFGGFGCDGLLMGESGKLRESLLSSMNDEAMRRIWLDTENSCHGHSSKVSKTQTDGRWSTTLCLM